VWCCQRENNINSAERGASLGLAVMQLVCVFRQPIFLYNYWLLAIWCVSLEGAALYCTSYTQTTKAKTWVCS